MPRRSFLARTAGAGAGLAFSGSLAAVLGGPAGADAGLRGSALGGGGRRPGAGYGDLVPDPAGVLDLPAGFRYRAFSRAGVDLLDDGSPVPSAHDGMAAFAGRGGRTVLVRNHEVDVEAVEEDGAVPVAHVAGHSYDPNGTGGTTTLVVDRHGRLESHRVSIAGTETNCAGGPTPWGTWLTCEETDEVLDGVRHGYVFEVDPVRGGDPTPIVPLGRFEHEAVAFDRSGTGYLTEDADTPFGQLYRFRPRRPGRGRGSLQAGGELSALRVPALAGTDLSAVTEAGTVFRDLEWVPIDQPDAPDGEKLRELYPATPIQKAEGTWVGRDGVIWFVSSFGGGPDAEEEEDRSAAAHGGQIWRYDPRRDRLELVVRFEQADDFEGPDNITVSPYGFAVMCTDGEDDRQFVAGITPDGGTFPIAFNQFSDDEFAGACFSHDGRTLFVNVQEPGTTFAITGPWRG
jgi:secreted PhoX family phosphatase